MRPAEVKTAARGCVSKGGGVTLEVLKKRSSKIFAIENCGMRPAYGIEYPKVALQLKSFNIPDVRRIGKNGISL